MKKFLRSCAVIVSIYPYSVGFAQNLPLLNLVNESDYIFLGKILNDPKEIKSGNEGDIKLLLRVGKKYKGCRVGQELEVHVNLAVDALIFQDRKEIGDLAGKNLIFFVRKGPHVDTINRYFDYKYFFECQIIEMIEHTN